MATKRKAVRVVSDIDLSKVVRTPPSQIYAHKFNELRMTGDNFRASGKDVTVQSLRTLASRHKKKTGVNVCVTKTDTGAVVYVP